MMRIVDLRLSEEGSCSSKFRDIVVRVLAPSEGNATDWSKAPGNGGPADKELGLRKELLAEAIMTMGTL